MENMRFKKYIFTVFAILAIFLSVFNVNTALSTSADEKTEETYNKKVNEYVGETEDGDELLSKIIDDLENNTSPDNTSILYAVKRLFSPGHYMNSVKDGTIAKKLGKKKNVAHDGIHACNVDEPTNLLNHNCNAPNFATEFSQNIAGMFYNPLNGGERTSAKAVFGFGVPVGVKENGVPADRSTSAEQFTALELYGYDLKFTEYNGEWDRITISTSARMLSNFGTIDHVRNLGTSFVVGAASGLGKLVDGFLYKSKNFVNLFTTVKEAFSAVTGGALNALMDTSDLNIFATKAWKRSQLDDSLYNVYVLSDREMLAEVYIQKFKLWTSDFNGKINASPELNEVMSLQTIPSFDFDPELETEKSIEAREKVQEHNDLEDEKVRLSEQAIEDYERLNEAGETIGGIPPTKYIPQYKEMPEKVFYTEAEQLQLFWYVDNEEILKKANKRGLIPAVKKLEDYDVLVADWNKTWEEVKTAAFHAEGKTIQDIIDEVDEDVYIKNPYIDTRQAIGHYACANADGTPMRNSEGELEYLYLSANGKTTENLNPKCKAPRTPIQGGLFGDGWHVDREVDTRHVSQVDSDSSFLGIIPSIRGAMRSLYRSLNSFAAKITNTILGLSFEPLLHQLGVDVIVETLVTGFRDTIFFPLSIIMGAVGGLFVFFQLLKNGSAVELLMGLFGTIIIFILGAMLLLRPEAVIKMADEWPTKADNFLANIMLGNSTGSEYCDTGEEQDGVRSAQCTIWSATVFNPWVNLQFGTSYNNLYAKGYAESGGNEMENSSENAELVGNAGVHMGAGVKIHNWALYQLEKTKSGSITTSNTSKDKQVGTMDKDLYRLVDLQAGPNNGAGTDSRFFEAWTGKNISSAGNISTMLATHIQALAILVVVAVMGYRKIEASFLFALMIIMLPFMLLYALMPQGKFKLKSYLSNLGGLFMKRMGAVALISIYLAMLNAVSATSANLITVSFINIILSIAFFMYSKELLALFESQSGGQMGEKIKEMASNTIPRDVKNKVAMKKAEIRGQAAGAIGGFAGAVGYNKEYRKQRRLEKKIDRLSMKDISLGDGLSEREQKSLEKAQRKYEERGGAKERASLFKTSFKGAQKGSEIIGRRQELKIRRAGQGTLDTIGRAKDKVISAGQEEIVQGKAPVELDTYKDIISTGNTQSGLKTSNTPLNRENENLLLNPRVQKILRKRAEETREEFKKKNKEAISKNDIDVDKLRDAFEARRQVERAKNKVFNRDIERDRKASESDRSKNITSSTEEIKDQILRKQQEEFKRKQEKLKKGDKEE